MTRPHWEVAYEEAVLEVDDSKLNHKLTYAEVVIRMQLRSANGNPKQSHERQALEKALQRLRILRDERLGSGATVNGWR